MIEGRAPRAPPPCSGSNELIPIRKKRGQYCQNQVVKSQVMPLYTEIFLPGPAGIIRSANNNAQKYLEEKDWADLEASPELDERLISSAKASSEPLPLLCLRCRVSAAVAKKLRAMHAKHRDQHELELDEMAACVLDDGGELVIRQKSRSSDGQIRTQRLPFDWETISAMPQREVKPLAADILRSYDSTRCALPSWTETLVQGNRELKHYLRSCGLLLISPWALIADTSPKRVKEAWEQCGEGAMNADQITELHASYLKAYWPAKETYKQEVGKSSGWIPDSQFLESLTPPQKNDNALRQLDQAIRRFLALKPSLFQDGEEAAIPDPGSLDELSERDTSTSDVDLNTLIQRALQKSAGEQIKVAIEKDQRKWQRDPNRLLAWQLYCDGIGQRDIASRCDHKQAWVSKLLQEKTLSHAIALGAATELSRHNAFKQIQMDPEGAERMVEALRNHLLCPEQDSDVAPLRRWIRSYLPQA